MSDAEYLRKVLAELDDKAGLALSLLDAVEDDGCEESDSVQYALETLQQVITEWQEAKGFIQ